MKKVGIILAAVAVCLLVYFAWPKAMVSPETKPLPVSALSDAVKSSSPAECTANEGCGPEKPVVISPQSKPDDSAATTKESQFQTVHDLLKDERGDAAVQSLLEILRTDPNNEHALVELATIYLGDPRYRSKGIAMLEKVLEQNPANDMAMGELLSVTQETPGGAESKAVLESVKASYAKNPDSANLAAGLGKLLVDQGDPSGVALLEKASADPKFAESSLNSLIATYAEARDAAKMADAYQRLLNHQQALLKEESAKGGPEAERLKRAAIANQIGLASALIASKQFDSAEKAIRQLREQSPDNRELAHLVSQLEKARRT